MLKFKNKMIKIKNRFYTKFWIQSCWEVTKSCFGRFLNKAFYTYRQRTENLDLIKVVGLISIQFLTQILKLGRCAFFAEKCNILNDQHFSSWSTKKLCSNEILCTTRWPVMGIWWVHGVFNVFEHGVLGYSLGIGVRVSQKVCTHQFSPTEQFLFSVVV